MTTPDSFRAQLSALRDDVLAHARHEEEDVFPALNTSADELKKLGERYEKALAAAPTCAHPHFPDTPRGTSCSPRSPR